MDVLQTINRRKSVRSFTGKAPDPDQLNTLLEAAQEAPVSMGEFDRYRLTVVTNRDLLNQIDQAGAQFFGKPDKHPLYGAPMLLIISAQAPTPGRENATYSTAAMIAHNVALAATELGLGQCCIWSTVIAAAARPEIVQRLGLPQDFVPCCGVALGQTDQEYTPRKTPRQRFAVNTVK